MSRAAGKVGKTSIARHCLECGTVFWTTLPVLKRGKGRFCSRPCATKSTMVQVTYVCQNCGKGFPDYPYRAKANRGKFCSKECQYAFGIPEEQRKRTSETLTGRKTGPHSAEWNEKIRLAQIGLKAGDKHPNWKGGVTKDGRKERNQSRYAKWRKDVLAAGKRECANCGETKNLDTHHIHRFLKFPELRYEVGNGLVLCEPCHYGLHFPSLARGA